MSKRNKLPSPPGWATALLERLCPDELLEEVGGDLQELFEEQVEEAGEKQARREYVLAVLGYMRLFAFKQNKTQVSKPIYTDMLQNYLTVGLRMLLRNKLRTFIHILGLSIGISTCLAIYQIVSFELSFNSKIPDGNRIYQVVSQVTHVDNTFINNGVPGPVASTIRKETTGMENVTAFYMLNNPKVHVPEKNDSQVFIKQKNVTFADPNLLQMLSYQWVSGSPISSLSAPYHVVLTEPKAELYFGKVNLQSIIGRELIYQDSIRVTVTGIVKELEGNTDFTFTDFISMATLEQTALLKNYYYDEWNSVSSDSRSFVMLSAGTSPEKVNKQLDALAKKYIDQQENFKISLQLQPMAEVHFKGSFYYNGGPSLANKSALNGLVIIAVFILVIACINFINLETAQAIYRAREVGIRKTLGSRRGELIWQFLSETLLLTLLAVIVSLFFTKALLYYFKDLIPLGLLANIFSLDVILFLAGITLAVGILAGFYPAIVLSGFSPIKSIRNQMSSWKSQTRSAFLRKNLTVIQFTLSQVFIFATLVIGQQIQHMLSADMGFNKDAIISLQVPRKTEENKKLLFTQQLKQITQISEVSLSNSTPASMSMWNSTVEFASPSGEISHDVQQKLGDTAFLHLYQIPLLAGRNVRTHSAEVIINETYRKLLGFKHPQEALQQTLYMDKNPLTIVGVMDDFHMRPLEEAIMPAMYRFNMSQSDVVNLKLSSRNKNAGEVKQTLSKLENTWKAQFPEESFSYTFIDETIQAFYQTEQNILKMLKVATGIAILISCLGLLGLSTFTIAQRTREIGIRKVLGASLSNIVFLISKDFFKLILLAFVFAAPIAWILLGKWLEDFNYRIQLEWWMFAAVGSLALVAALLTVGYQSIKAASANPVKSLRSE